MHKGPFDDAFFAGFTKSKASPDFVYKFVEQGEGDTAVNFRARSAIDGPTQCLGGTRARC